MSSTFFWCTKTMQLTNAVFRFVCLPYMTSHKLKLTTQNWFALPFDQAQVIYYFGLWKREDGKGRGKEIREREISYNLTFVLCGITCVVFHITV